MIARLGLCACLLAACAPRASAQGLEVTDAWIRLPPPGANTAAYMTIQNNDSRPHRLVAIRSEVCERTELHRTVIEGGVARMSPVQFIELPAGESVQLAPRGLHLMLIRPSSLRDGQRVELELELEDGAATRVEAVVRGPGHSGAHSRP